MPPPADTGSFSDVFSRRMDDLSADFEALHWSQREEFDEVHQEIGYIRGVVKRMSTAQETFFQEYRMDQLQKHAREDQLTDNFMSKTQVQVMFT